MVCVYAYHLECRVALISPATVTVWVTLGGLMFMFTPQTQKVCGTATNGRCKPSSYIILGLYSKLDPLAKHSAKFYPPPAPPGRL